MIDEVGEQGLAPQFFFAEEKLEQKMGPFQYQEWSTGQVQTKNIL